MSLLYLYFTKLVTPLTFTLGFSVLLYLRQGATLARAKAKSSWQTLVLLCCILVVTASCLGSFSGQDQREAVLKVRFSEIYHYYIGAKYYSELEHTKLYRCTMAAFNEIDIAGTRVPRIRRVRDLSDTWAAESLADMRRLADTRCDGLFESGRWASFTDDLKILLQIDSREKTWSRILVDHGNNPPPSWNVIAGSVANILPLSPLSHGLFAWFDLALMLVLVTVVVWRVFGFYSAAAYLLLMGVQPMMPLDWDGAGYFREIWLASLALGLCALHARWFFYAGLFLGVSACARVFPVFFIFGAVLPLLWSWKSEASFKSLLRLGAGLLISVLTLFAFSIIIYSIDHWQSFAAIIDSHANNVAANAIGYKRHMLSSLYDLDTARSFLIAEDFTGAQKWYEFLGGSLGFQKFFIWGYTGVALFLACAVAIKVKPAEAAIIVGTVCLFFLTSAYSYYYLFLPLLAVVWLADKDTTPGSRIYTYGLYAVYLILIWYFPFQYEHVFGFFTATSNVLFVYLVGLLVVKQGEVYFSDIRQCIVNRSLTRLQWVLLFPVISMVAGAVYSLSRV